jgi:hypothetical protein
VKQDRPAVLGALPARGCLAAEQVNAALGHADESQVAKVAAQQLS